MRRRTVPVPARAAVGAVLTLAVVACGQPEGKPVEVGAPPAAPAATPAAPGGTGSTTTAAPAPSTFPLLGLPIADPALAAHQAVVVKMDNSPEARPQTGLNEADVVYELLVEGITRYALVYHSRPVGEVGPVRSARSSDFELTANLGRPLIVWSGGNPGVTAELHGAEDRGFLVDAGVDEAPSRYWRSKDRVAPHNLYADVAGLLGDLGAPDATAPPPLFAYRAPGEPYAGESVPAAGVTIDFGAGVRADYVWDAERGGWNRFQVDARHRRPESATVDRAGVQVAPPNVVVLFLEYGVSAADRRSPMAISTGSGDAVVLTDGRLVRGRWRRESAMGGWELTDLSGQPIRLTPGRTWVALPQAGSTVTELDAATADALLAVRR